MWCCSVLNFFINRFYPLFVYHHTCIGNSNIYRSNLINELSFIYWLQLRFNLYLYIHEHGLPFYPAGVIVLSVVDVVACYSVCWSSVAAAAATAR